MSSNNKIILAPMQPQRFEGRNLRTPKRSNQSDDVYLIQLEVTREAWEAMETIPKTNIVEGILWHHDGDEPEPQVSEKPKKADKPKGEWGPYWTEMFKRGFDNHPDLREILDQLKFLPLGSTGTVKDALHEVFAVSSLTFVDPDAFEKWAQDNRLAALKTMSRNARGATEETNAKAS